jgi:hypothetical protein
MRNQARRTTPKLGWFTHLGWFTFLGSSGIGLQVDLSEYETFVSV